MSQDARLYCKQHQYWIIERFILKEQIGSAIYAEITINTIDKTIQLNKTIDIITPDISYKFIIYKIDIDYAASKNHITLLHSMYVLEKSKNINFFQNLTHKAIINNILKVFNIKSTIKLPYNYKKELEIQYNESPLEFIKRICSVENSVVVAIPDGSIYIGVYNQPKATQLYLTKNWPYKNDELLVQKVTGSIDKKNHTIMGYTYDNPNKAFCNSTTTRSINYDHYGDLCDNLRQYKKFTQDIHQHEQVYRFQTVSNNYYPLLSKIKIGKFYLYIIEIDIQYTYCNRQRQMIAVYHNIVADIPIHYYQINIPTQRAQVVGGILTSKGSVSLDRNNRVYVSFYSDKKKNKIPVLVSSLMSSPNGGMVWMPRVSEEVLVHFIDHSSHQPIIIHSLYNKVNLLPDQTKIDPKYSYGFTLGTPEQPSRYNSFWMHTQDQKELIEFKGQKDFSITLEEGNYLINLNSAKNATKHKTHIKKGDYLLNIDKGSQTITLKNGDSNVILNNGNYTIETTGSVSIVATKDINLDANNININGTNEVNINSKSININGDKSIKLDSKLQMKIKSTQLSINIKSIFKIKALIFKLTTKTLMHLKSKLLFKTDSLISISKSKTISIVKSLIYMRDAKLNAIKGFFISVGVIISGIWSFAIPQPT